MILKEKKGQVTIFIIVGIILIGIILLFFAFRSGIIEDITKKPEENPEAFLKICMEDKLKEAIKIVGLKGGYPDNELSINFKFGNEDYHNITYLCYQQGNYLPCINQKPNFMNDLKEEIKNYISEDIENCFNEVSSLFKDKGYTINSNYEDAVIEIIPKRVFIQTDSEIILTKGGETTRQEDFKIEIPSRLYELSFIIQEIVNQEARFCYAEISGIMLIYPEFSIDKFKTGESTNIYTLIHKKSEEKFRFAIRSCVIPTGMI
jgi:hypothetical protein|tara:strand:+ start:9113 stop:9898 length:786 start_codon:yes stop_codon:yes gene_type:complete